MARDRNRLRDFFMYELLEEEFAREKERAEALESTEDDEENDLLEGDDDRTEEA